MHTNKIVSTVLSIEDTNILYAASDDAIIDLFNQMYSNKCYSGAFLIKANKIIRRGDLEISYQSHEANATLSIEIDTDIIVYEKGDIVVGKVVKIDATGNVILTSDYASMIIEKEVSSKNAMMKTISIGETIPMLVISCAYPIFKKKVSIMAEPFMPQHNSNSAFYIIEDVVAKDTSFYYDIIKNKEAEVEKLRKEKPREFKHFENLLYGKTKVTKNMESITNLEKAKGIVYRPYNMRGMPYYTTISKDAIKMEHFLIIKTIVFDYLKELDQLHTLVSAYSMDEINNLSHIWTAYSKTKPKSEKV